jgi:centromeric protein E
MRGDNSSPLPPLEFIGVSNTSSATMSSDDSSYYEERGRDGRSKQRHFENGRSPSPTKGNDRMRKSAATPTVDNRRRKIFPKQNGNSGVHQSKNRLRDRKTKIQVCVRVRPLLPSDQRVTNNLPPVPEEGAKGKRSTGASRHTKLTPTRPMRSRSSSPSMRSSKKDIVDAAPAWTVHNDNISQAPHTNPETSRVNDYTFDNSFGPENSTSDIYHSTVKDSVHSTMDGYHASVFAYGQTATGKTYTMTGSAGMSNMNPDDDSTKGIIQFAIQDCFNYIYNQKTETREYLLRVSFMEIYNEVINDLLAVPTKTAPFMGTSMQAPPPAPSSIRIFESKNEGVIIRGLKEEIVTCPEQVFSLLAAGEKRRQTGATNLNKQSSRSHSIFRLIVESRKRISRMSTSNRTNMSDGSSVADSIASSTFAPESTSGPVRVSTLSLVDLAGSESVKNTKSTGARKKEGQYINKSLLTLGHVVYKLAEISSKSIGGRVVDATHIPVSDLAVLTNSGSFNYHTIFPNLTKVINLVKYILIRLFFKN